MAHAHTAREAGCRIPGGPRPGTLLSSAITGLLIACGPVSTTPADSNPPTTPAGLTATANGPFAANLSWQPSTDTVGVTGYRVERCQGAGCSAFAQVAAPTGTSFTDIGLAAASSYSYRVRASDAAANLSAPSNVADLATAAAPTPSPAVLPAWVAALAIGEWHEIPSTAMSSVAPSPQPLGNTGPASKVIAWTSFVVDTRTSKVYSVANGGHQDYSGNEVDVLDLERDQPVWSQILPPTPSPQLTNCQSYYADGAPASRHTYYGVTLNEIEDRIMLFAGANWCNGGGFHTAISSYNITANTWSAPGTHGNLPNVFADVSAISRDPTTGDVYVGRNFSFGRWNRSSNAFNLLNPTGNEPAGDGAMSAFDTTRGGILFLGGSINSDFYTLSGNAWTPVALTGTTADTDAVSKRTQGAMPYVAAIDSYLVRLAGAGSTVYLVNAANFAVATFATTGGATIPSTMNGPYNKFLYVPRLKGCVYVPSYSGNAWFLRVH
jgi:chitodextrinase